MIVLKNMIMNINAAESEISSAVFIGSIILRNKNKATTLAMKIEDFITAGLT